MQLLTRRMMIMNVVEAWAAQYGDYPPDYLLNDGMSPHEILKELKKLDLETCSEKDVLDIIGRECTGWTRPTRCYECGDDNEEIAQLSLDGDDITVYYLCRNCAKRMLNLFSPEIPQ